MTEEEKQVLLLEEITNDYTDEIKTTYKVGDFLPTELSNGVKLTWSITQDRYFDKETYECTGSEGSDAVIKLTATFDDGDVLVDKEFEITVLDTFLRNNENGIVDGNLYDYLLNILDTDEDNKISINEAYDFTGDIVINRDGTGHFGDEIATTQGFDKIPGITSITINGIKIDELIINDLQNLEEVHINSNNTNVISLVHIENTPSVTTIDFGTSKIDTLELVGGFSIRNLDLSYKDLRVFNVTGSIGSIKELNLQGNTELESYSFLQNVLGIEKLHLNNSALDLNKVNSIPAMTSLKVLILSHNDTLEDYTFLTNAKFPKLEVIDFTSNTIINLELKDFAQLQEIIIENVRSDDVDGIRELRLINLPRFKFLTRNIETKLLNLYINGCDELANLSIEFNEQFTMTSLYINNSGLEHLILNENTMINTVEMRSLRSLEVLNLSNTRITDITFYNMVGLKDFKFDQITAVDNYGFLSNAPNLEALSIAANNLNTEKMSYVSTMSNLKEINLSYNPGIVDYSFLTSFVSLETLNIGFNEIDTLEFDSIPLLNSLVHLDMSDNPSIDEINLSQLPNLKILNISSTIEDWYITVLELNDLPEFDEFVRSSATYIAEVILVDLPILESFNLSSSGVNTITISNCIMLKSLDISYNSDISITVE
jgi:Leucine-rich repeat (LRR) protein